MLKFLIYEYLCEKQYMDIVSRYAENSGLLRWLLFMVEWYENRYIGTQEAITMSENEKYYTVTEAAELFGQSKSTVVEWCAQGRINNVQIEKKDGVRIYIPESEVMRILKPTLDQIEESRIDYENGWCSNVRDLANK